MLGYTPVKPTCEIHGTGRVQVQLNLVITNRDISNHRSLWSKLSILMSVLCLSGSPTSIANATRPDFSWYQFEQSNLTSHIAHISSASTHKKTGKKFEPMQTSKRPKSCFTSYDIDTNVPTCAANRCTWSPCWWHMTAATPFWQRKGKEFLGKQTLRFEK